MIQRDQLEDQDQLEKDHQEETVRDRQEKFNKLRQKDRQSDSDQREKHHQEARVQL